MRGLLWHRTSPVPGGPRVIAGRQRGKRSCFLPSPCLRPNIMNPTKVLQRLLAMACTGLIALPLPGQTPPALHEAHAAGAEPLPGDGPLGAIHAHVCGFHFYSGDMKRALRVDHYCSHLNHDVFQCVIYDSAARNARLIGVEYIISETLFKQLPPEEKKLWHSHRYEVMSGLLTAPGASDVAEKELMLELVNTYGKTWHLWQVDRGDQLPLGLPQLMMGFTADGQVDAQLVAERDRDRNIDPAAVKAKRADFPVRPVAAGADGWQQGPAFQINAGPPTPSQARP